jgi:uncharacterized protein YdaU (DUF1376 family)
MNFFPFHLGDYAAATGHLTWLEDAAYTRLLRRYYADERPLPGEETEVFRLVGARSKSEKEAVRRVLLEFFFKVNHSYHNKRADSEIARFRKKSEQNQANAAIRWMRTQCDGIPVALRSDGVRNANHNQNQNHNRDTSPSGSKEPSGDESSLGGEDAPVGQLALLPGEPEATPDPGGKKPKVGKPLIPMDLLNEMAAEWNAMARRVGLAQVSIVTQARAVSLRARIWDHWRADPMSGWRSHLDAIAASPFLRGESERGWRADFDWAIQPRNVVKVAEGKYSRGDD